MNALNNERAFSNYELQEKIKDGAFVTVYLAKKNKMSYVFKEIRMHFLTPVERQRAFNEVNLMQSLNHQNVIKYKDFMLDHVKGKLSIVMEYANNGDLAEAIVKQKGVPFSTHKTISWFIQINLALQYIHAQNILHRDLKPENIFLCGDYTIKVGDFGVSRLMKNSEEFASTGIGTPYYLSPEICMRKPYNSKSDMWALGCILFEIATLKRPFEAENFVQLVDNILDGKRTSFPSWMTNELIQHFVEDLLCFYPDQRSSTSEVLAFPPLQPYLSRHAQRTKDLSPSFTTNVYKSPDNSLKRSKSLANSNNSKLLKSSQRMEPAQVLNVENEKNPTSASSLSTPTTPHKIDKSPAFFMKNKPKPRYVFTRTTPRATYAIQTRSTSKQAIQTDTITSAEQYQKKEQRATTSENVKSPENFMKNNPTPHLLITPPTPVSINSTVNKRGEKTFKSETVSSSESNMNVTYIVKKSSKSFQSTPTDNDPGYSSEEVNCSADSDSACEHLMGNETELSIKESTKLEEESLLSDQSHCNHSQCIQCMINMLWKNRIRSCEGVSGNSDYLKLKKKLLLIFSADLFQKVYESLLQEWEHSESSQVQSSILNYAKVLNYEQLQNLPLMVQLIQLDMVKLSKKDKYSNELVMM